MKERVTLHIRRCRCVVQVDRSPRQQKGKVAGQNREQEVFLDSKYGDAGWEEVEKLPVNVGFPASTSK